jgi:hypothetical protein
MNFLSKITLLELVIQLVLSVSAFAPILDYDHIFHYIYSYTTVFMTVTSGNSKQYSFIIIVIIFIFFASCSSHQSVLFPKHAPLDHVSSGAGLGVLSVGRSVVATRQSDETEIRDSQSAVSQSDGLGSGVFGL